MAPFPVNAQQSCKDATYHDHQKDWIDKMEENKVSIAIVPQITSIWNCQKKDKTEPGKLSQLGPWHITYQFGVQFAPV